MIHQMDDRFTAKRSRERADAFAPIDRSARRLLRARLRSVTRRVAASAVAAEHTPEDVHQVRVATRRASAAIAVLRPWLKRSTRLKSKRRLDRLRDAAGAVRRGDVYLDMLSQQLERADARVRPVLEALRLRAQRDRAEALDRWREVASTRRLRRWKPIARRLARAMNVADEAEAGASTMRSAAALFLPRIQIELRSMIDAAMDLPESVHRLRIMSKRLRYALEIMESGLDPARSSELLLMARRLQDQLGPINDLHELATSLEQWSGEDSAKLDGAIAAALPELAGLYRDEVSSRLRRFRGWWEREARDELTTAIERCLASCTEPVNHAANGSIERRSAARPTSGEPVGSVSGGSLE